MPDYECHLHAGGVNADATTAEGEMAQPDDARPAATNTGRHHDAQPPPVTAPTLGLAAQVEQRPGARPRLTTMRVIDATGAGPRR